MKLHEWAIRWNIPQKAFEELMTIYGAIEEILKDNPLRSEAELQNLIRLEASQKYARLWRNNVGATYTAEGSFIRFGLANDSSAVNKKIKSADLIGIRSIKITTSMVGLTIGQFVSREVKASNWKYTGTPRELAQFNWINLILSFGGDACFANRIGTI